MNPFVRQFVILFLTLTPVLGHAAELKLTQAQLDNVNLDTTTVIAREDRPRLEFTATLTADRLKTYRVAPVVDGVVTQLKVVAHDEVREGQVLARLRSHTLGRAQADYLEALARFDLARAERKRIEGLWKDGVVAESRWLGVESDYKSAQATLDVRRRLLSLTGLSDEEIKQLPNEPDRLAEFDLISPINGLVTRVEVESGQMLSAGQAGFHVDDLSTLWAMVKIPVASLPQIAVGSEAEIRVQANPGRSYAGRLESLGGEVESLSQTLEGRIVLANPKGLLRPGMYAEVTLTGVGRDGLMVPASAVFIIGNQPYVFKVLGEGRFEPVAIEMGAESEGWVRVLSGIPSGTEVVTSGVAELKSHWQYQGGE